MPKMGRFLNCFTGKNQLLFRESKLFYHGIQYLKNTLHPRWEVRQILKIALFFGQTPYNFNLCNCLINPVTNKFYFGILVRVANETGCESRTNDDKIYSARTPLSF